MSRVAIVIGVNRTTGLAELRGAAADANRFGAWVAKQGFETKPFTDDRGQKVKFSDIFDEVKRIVEVNTYSQLLIYFSGHGFQSSGSEVWLLSGAPENTAEAIALEPSIMAARESGLASVVFISDACRSIPSTLEFSRVTGTSIFPNKPLNRATRPKVDRFFATLPSLVAVEAAKANDEARRGGVFTRELIGVHRNTPVKFVERIQENGQPIEVLTNRTLGDLVRESVEDAVFAVAPQAGQLPDSIIESVKDYIGRVERPVEGTEARPGLEVAIGEKSWRSGLRRESREGATSVVEIAQQAIVAAGAAQQFPSETGEARKVDDEVGLSKTIERYSAPVPVEKFESETGFSISGTTIDEAWSNGFHPDILSGEILRLWPRGQNGGSVLIRFADGGGTMLAALSGYIGHIFVENGAVTNVNYVPAMNNYRWPDYEQEKERLKALRAAVAAAAGLGVFRVAPENAKAFAERIRNLKRLDPTLGLYAAYAYASVGLEADVASVGDYMRGDLQVDLLDVAMLARRGVVPGHRQGVPVVPACPMLAQGWSLLPVRDARLAPVIDEARLWLRPALWTTFAPEGVALLEPAIKNGAIS